MKDKKEQCGQCMFWRNKKRWIDANLKECFSAECHRNPPATNGHEAYFPTTNSDDWCGEFKTSEKGNK